MTGRERLARWMERSRLNQRQTAQIFGVHFAYLSQILSGRRSPGLANAITIERETGIPVEAWVPTEVGDYAETIAGRDGKRKVSK